MGSTSIKSVWTRSKKFYLRSKETFTKLLTVSVCVSCAAVSLAANQYSMGVDYATGRVIDIDNTGEIDGFRLTSGYYPENFWWRNFQLFFQGNFAFFHSTFSPLADGFKDNLWIVSVVPIFRYHFFPEKKVDVFFDVSAGPGYLSTTRFENRNLGIHYTFQDMLGIGVLFGDQHRYSAGLRVVHYSNASISEQNRGFTIPVIASFSYNF